MGQETVTATTPQLTESDVEQIEAGARLDQCCRVVSSAVPNCVCRRPAGHVGAHSESVPPTDAFWIHPAIPALIRDLRALRAERDAAMTVLAPSMPESGLEDACRQLKQACMSEADNCEALEQINMRLSTGLVNIYHVITGEACPHGVALGMATSAVSSLKSENAALREQLDRACEQRDGWERARRDDEATFERIANSIGMFWCCMAETMELESRIKRVVASRDDLQSRLAQAEQEVRGVLDTLGEDAIRSRSDGGEEDIYESLAISVTKLQSHVRASKAFDKLTDRTLKPEVQDVLEQLKNDQLTNE